MASDFGKHYLVDLFGCDPNKISVADTVREIFVAAARESNATVIGELFHQFEPIGVSGVLLIAESHFSIHTWPEDGFVALDVFTCGEEMDALVAIDILEAALGASRVEVQVPVRGRLGDGSAPVRETG